MIKDFTDIETTTIQSADELRIIYRPGQITAEFIHRLRSGQATYADIDRIIVSAKQSSLLVNKFSDEVIQAVLNHALQKPSRK